MYLESSFHLMSKIHQRMLDNIHHDLNLNLMKMNMMKKIHLPPADSYTEHLKTVISSMSLSLLIVQ